MSDYEHPGIEVVIGDEPEEVFEKAYKNAARLLPRFTDLVRVAAGKNDLQVVIGDEPGAKTDGQVVHLGLVPEFAAVNPADPCVCDTDPDECLYHRSVGLLLHEAAHISEGSTVQPDKDFVERVVDGLETLVDNMPEPQRTEVQSTFEPKIAKIAQIRDRRVDYARLRSPLELAYVLVEESPMVVNAFEDARINTAVGDRRSALGQQMNRLVGELVLRAAEGEGVVEGPLGYQVAVGVEVELEHGLDLRPVLTSEAVTACLGDKYVQSMTDLVPLKTVADSTALGVALCGYAQAKYGLYVTNARSATAGRGRAAANTLKSGKDLQDGKVKESQRLRDKRMLSDPTRAMVRRSTAATSTPPDEGAAPIDTKSIEAAMNASRGDGVVSDEQELLTVPGGTGLVMSGEGLYTPVVLRPDFAVEPRRERVQVLPGYKYPAGGGLRGAEILNVKADQAVVAGQRILADALGMNRRSASVPNLVRGRLHGSKLARVPTGNRRAFRRIDKPRKRSYAVLIGVDQSGSTSGCTMRYLKELAFAQSALLAKLGVPFAVAGHTGDRYSFESEADVHPDAVADLRSTLGLGSTLGHSPSLATIQLVKNFAEPWDEAAQSGVAALHTAKQNLDGVTMRAYIDMLCTQRATDRILLYYTDGKMPAQDYDNQRLILEAQCRRAKAIARLPDRRLHLVGVGVGTDSPKAYGLDTIEVHETDGLDGVRVVVDGLAERIAGTVNG